LIATLRTQAASDSGSQAQRLLGFLRWHPTASDRLAALEQPSRLQRTGFLVPGLIGFAFGIGQPPLAFFFNMLTDGVSANLGRELATYIYIIPISGLAGAAIWRDAFSATERGLLDIRAGLLGLASGLGVNLGFRISFMSVLGPGYDDTFPGLFPSILLLVGFFLWIRAGAFWWLSSIFERRTVVYACWGGLALGTFILATMWLDLTMFHMIFQSVIRSAVPEPELAQASRAIFFALPLHPTTFVLATSPYLYLVIPRWRDSRLIPRRRAVQVLRWSLVYTTALASLRIIALLIYTPEFRATDNFKLNLFGVYVVVAVLFQASLVTSLTLRRPTALIGEACFWAIISGLLMSVGLIIVNLAFGGHLSVFFVWTVVAYIVNFGAAVAFCVAAFGSGLRYALAGFRPLPVSPAMSND
jgi:hypothetical protein